MRAAALWIFLLPLFVSGTATPCRANCPPADVEFVAAPAEGDTVFGRVPFSWQLVGADSALHFLGAVDPPVAGDTLWFVPWDTSITFFFTSRIPVEPLPPSGPVLFVEPHRFVLKAILPEGCESSLSSRAFVTSTVAPQVQVTSPLPNPLTPVAIGSSVTFTWQGTDADGWFTNRPVRYMYTLVTSWHPKLPGIADNISFVRSYPDSFRKLVAPNFEGWYSCSGDTTFASFWNLTFGAQYVFCVVAFDEMGAYSARFSTTTNLVWVRTNAPTGVTPLTEPSEMFVRAEPNPARRSVRIDFAVPRSDVARLEVHDVLGRRVRTLYSGEPAAGTQDLSWDLRDARGATVAPGLYLIRLSSGSNIAVRRLIVVD